MLILRRTVAARRAYVVGDRPLPVVRGVADEVNSPEYVQLYADWVTLDKKEITMSEDRAWYFTQGNGVREMSHVLGHRLNDFQASWWNG